MLLRCLVLATSVSALAPAPDVESRVIASIKNVASERSLGALGEFGAATGDLFVSKLTPETVEDVTRFWQDGAAAGFIAARSVASRRFVAHRRQIFIRTLRRPVIPFLPANSTH